MRPNILDLCPYWCWPTTGGGPVRVYNINKAVSEYVNISQFSVRPTLGHRRGRLASWIGSRQYNHATNYVEFEYFNFFILGVSYLLYRYGIHSDISLSSLLSFFPSNRLKKEFTKADIIQVEHPWLFNFAWRHSKGKPLVYVAHNVEADLWQRKGKGGFKGRARVEDMEREAVRLANEIICMSEEDHTILLNRYMADPSRITIIPNGIDPNVARSVSPSERSKLKLGLQGKFVILFIGSDHYPNKEAIEFIKSWQPVLEKYGHIQFLIIGTVGRGIQSSDYMRVDGFVENLQDYLLSADLAVNPLVSGSGMNLKLLEYLNYGIPTISTKIGMRGTDFVPGREIILAEINEFPNIIAQVPSNPNEYKKIGENGQRAVKDKYSWSSLSQKMFSVYQKTKIK